MPTSVDFVQCEPTQMVVAYTSANAYVFDIEKCKPVVTLDYKPSLGNVIWYCLYAYYYCYYNRFMTLCPGLPGCRYQKDKPFWILLNTEMTGWQWHQLNSMQAICTSL